VEGKRRVGRSCKEVGRAAAVAYWWFRRVVFWERRMEVILLEGSIRGGILEGTLI